MGKANKQLSKRQVFAGLIVIVAFSIGIFSLWYQQRAAVNENVPHQISEFLISFLETCKNDPENAVSFCHFEDDSERQAYQQSNIKLVSYEVLEESSLSDDLYVFKVHLAREFTDIPERYYFVGSIGGKLYLMNNIYNIPEEMLIDLDNDIFTQYSDNGLVLSGDRIR